MSSCTARGLGHTLIQCWGLGTSYLHLPDMWPASSLPWDCVRTVFFWHSWWTIQAHQYGLHRGVHPLAGPALLSPLLSSAPMMPVHPLAENAVGTPVRRSVSISAKDSFIPIDVRPINVTNVTHPGPQTPSNLNPTLVLPLIASFMGRGGWGGL